MIDDGQAIESGYLPAGRLFVGSAWAESEARAIGQPDLQVGAYRPDSTVDGWAAGRFVVRGASVRGDGHRYRGVPRQDDMSLAWHQETGHLIVAVADGVSAAPLSHIGASAACRYAVDLLLRECRVGEEPDWARLLNFCAWGLVETWQRLDALPAPDPEATERQLATTLCAVIVSAGDGAANVRAVSVGDSGLAVIRGDRIVPLLGGKLLSDGITDHSVVPLPRIPDHPSTGEWRLEVSETLLIGTDGIWDPVGDGTGTVARVMAVALGGELPPRSDFLRLADFGRDTFDDDRTLVAVQVRAEDPAAGVPVDAAAAGVTPADSLGFGGDQGEGGEGEEGESPEQQELAEAAHVLQVGAGDDSEPDGDAAGGP